MNTMNILLSTQEDAVKFVRTVSRYPFDVDLSEGGDTIDAKSILGVLSVAVGRNDAAENSFRTSGRTLQ